MRKGMRGREDERMRGRDEEKTRPALPAPRRAHVEVGKNTVESSWQSSTIWRGREEEEEDEKEKEKRRRREGEERRRRRGEGEATLRRSLGGARRNHTAT